MFWSLFNKKKRYNPADKEIEVVTNDICAEAEVENANKENYWTRLGYKVCDAQKRHEFVCGQIVSLSEGVYMTLEKSEVFRFVIATASECFGTDLMIVSFMDSEGKIIPGINFEFDSINNKDTFWTCRVDKFYVKYIYSLNDYNLIRELYSCAQEPYRDMLDDDKEKKSFYKMALRYFERHNCQEAVRAIKDIHDERKKVKY